MKVKNVGRVGAVLLAAALGAAAMAGPAMADPSSATDFRSLTGVGSDTTQDVMNGFGNAYAPNGTKVVASWDARGTSPIKTKATNCVFPRPDGSGAGRQALRASEGENLGGTHGGPGFFNGAAVQGCADFARSSSYGGPTPPATAGNYTYIPFGVDAVGLARNVNGDIPANISFAQVQRVYKCFDTAIAGNTVTPRMIQAASGTWQFWTGKMGITEAEINLGDYSCLARDADSNPATPAQPNLERVQEHDGTVLNNNLNQIVPFSAGQFIAQSNVATIATATGVTVTDRRGQAALTGMRMPGQAIQQPIVGGVLNTAFPLRRDVYNVVPTSKLANAAIDAAFTGADSALCTSTVNVGGTNRSLIELFGFGKRTANVDLLNAACGSTDLKANS
ncbi:hypothetical protein Ais01nite_24040 [Asanoa ishikariensis]|uniref:PBP domain-containing protein n=1 Tax=Asanoa ishikariensis TaxID=137265 RepID=A0A1H3R7D3_9ACTN|nr:hypothetical protein [Asanoa ishikariensis]GIF64369.1 hypothetical protein Ais01nite_24040 [Asanoa ishikariensis]SDZ21225.1 hypothetical protein SAMN05421684_3515 [Asanoa ishikariensis]